MEIIESDLKQIFQWLKVTDDIVKSQQALIESLEDRISNIELLLTQEDNKQLFLIIKNRKNKS